MSDTTTITPEERAQIRARFERKYTDPCREAEYGRTTAMRILDALEQAEGRAKDNSEALTAAYMSGKYDGRKEAEARAEKAEKELAGADAEIAELRDELEDSRGTEKDAPNILCAIARLVGVYEHSQEIGDDMGEMTLDVVRDLLAEKQKPRALPWTHEPPKVAGWYWVRLMDDQYLPQIAKVTLRDIEIGFEKTPRQWAGPIAPPIEP